MLTQPFPLDRVLNGLLIYTIAFPFVPTLIPGTDTQPLFLLAIAVVIGASLVLPEVGRALFHVSLGGATLFVFGATLLLGLTLAVNLRDDASTLVPRLVSFAQFCAAAVWAYATRLSWKRSTIFNLIAVYAAFTVVYFMLGGAIEDLLIRSRQENAAILFLHGRGARTLSPEPSFFALQVFNLFVLSRLVPASDGDRRRPGWLWLGIIGYCLAASFSAYGAVLLVVVFAVMYPRMALVGAGLLTAFFGAVFQRLPEWESIRAVRVLLALIESRGNVFELMALDQSFSGRVSSFLSYVDAFWKHPIGGEAFSLGQGGGFVSVIAAFGLLAAFGFFALIPVILLGPWRLVTKGMLLGWFVLNFISGPVGVPILGVIVGTMVREFRGSLRSRVVPAVVAPASAPA
jgi:hypothetical protein